MKYVRKTDYKCQYEGVAVSNASIPDPGSVKQTKSRERVGDDLNSHWTQSGISGVAIAGPGGDESESFKEGLRGRNPN